jgi:hypothetical protein
MRRSESSGLGLAITQEIVGSMAGRPGPRDSQIAGVGRVRGILWNQVVCT